MRSSIAIGLACLVALICSPVRAADESDELMPGRIVIIKTGKLAKFVAKPPTGGTFDLPDSDTLTGNNPTVEGGLLEMFDDSPFTPAGVDFVLPAAGWKGLGEGASKGFKYSGAGSSGDPCRVVLVEAKVVKAVCKGPDVTLPTPFQGQVGIVLSIGTDTKRYCALFGGVETKNDGTMLKRKDASAPGACPLDLNSSTTIPPTSSTSTTSTTSTTTTDTVPPPSSTSTSTTTTASGTVTTTSTTLLTCQSGAATGATCATYCSCMVAECPGKFASEAACLSACPSFSETQLCCRAEHCGHANSDPGTHCPHAAGEAVCP